MVTSSSALLGCLSSSPQVVPPPEFTPVKARVSSPASQTKPTWALRPDKPARAWKYIVLHHSATDGGEVASIDAEHKQREDAQGNPWLGIGYHFVVGNGHGMPDGAVEPTFRWRDQLHGAHAANHEYNELGIGICLIGDFEQQPPTTRQVAAMRELLAALMAEYDLQADDLVLHRDVAATKCPGRHFDLEAMLSQPAPSATTARLPDRQAMALRPPHPTPSPRTTLSP